MGEMRWGEMWSDETMEKDWFNILKPRQNAGHFADGIFKFILSTENVCILIQISLKNAHRVPINDETSLVLIMAWQRIGNKPLPEMVVI